MTSSDTLQKFKVGVMGLPIRKDGSFLLSQRYAPDNPVFDGKWQLIGGGMEFGEDAVQTLAREFEEEIQTSVRVLYPYPIVKTSVWSAVETDRDHDSHVLLLNYLVAIDGQTPDVAADDETADAAWFTLEEITELATFKHTTDIILEAEKLIKRFDLLSQL